MKEFLSELLSSDFMPHGYCYLWKPGLVWLHLISDSLIALAYFSIPVALIYFIRKRRDVPFNWIFASFGLFILACGASHLMEIWTLWHATYWLSGGVKAFTAVVSVPTAVLLFRLVPEAIALPSPEALRQEIAQRRRVEEALQQAKSGLELRVQQRTAELQKTNENLVAEIEQRSQIAEELRRTQERFRLLVDTAEQYAIFILDPTGHVVSWNAGAQRIKGYQAEEIIGQHIGCFYLAEDVRDNKPEAALRVAAGEGRFEEQGWRVRKDGSRFWADVVVAALRDAQGTLIGFSKITRDLTERKQAEQALHENEELLRLAQNASGSGAWDWNPRTDVVTWSDQHFKMFGLEPSSGKITWASFLELLHVEDRADMQLAILEALRPDGKLNTDYRIARPDGQVRWMVSKGQTHCNSAGEPVRMIGLTFDITERKQLEQALLKTQAEVAHLSRVLTMGELTSSIAHEVNQPLAAVVTNGDACLRWLAGDPPNLEKARESLTGIIKEGNRASEIIKRIRTLAKKTATRKTMLNVNEVILEVLDLVGAQLALHHVLLRTDLGTELPGVFGDRVQLQQVILNLIANGIDAMSEVTDRPRELSIRSRASNEEGVIVGIRDCGSGFGPRSVERLFDAFFTTKQAGMGLGLSISRTIVEGHGGRLWAMANSGPGATFQFTLPMVRGAAG
jgi:PAS domain S-box-containing protein